MKLPSLTLRQRQILLLMLQHGTTIFAGGTRGFSWVGLASDAPGGLLIRAYQTPEYFLAGRGLIERVPMNAAGTWYRLTGDGNRIAARLLALGHRP